MDKRLLIEYKSKIVSHLVLVKIVWVIKWSNAVLNVKDDQYRCSSYVEKLILLKIICTKKSTYYQKLCNDKNSLISTYFDSRFDCSLSEIQVGRSRTTIDGNYLFIILLIDICRYNFFFSFALI